MSFNQLKVEDIEKIFSKIYENACELLEESEILYNNGKHARAYLCAHIAFEEFGKLPMLNSVAIDVFFGKNID
ncbi:AbiV family abortive infection protein [Neobacillus niacini]|uniref:AbiV family abortive infection protein n=1 Tax=Neobacillus niacini TaxID=86668 RepID=UPI0005ED7DF7|nr:AbiV family abortive infection protein [Neobacillus niacini]